MLKEHKSIKFATCLFLQYGYSTLHCASANGRTEVVKLLLAAGANKDVVNDVSSICCLECIITYCIAIAMSE